MNCDLGMEFIEQAGRHTLPGFTYSKKPVISTNWLLAQLQTPEMRRTWQSFLEVLKRPYWERSWIVQELFVGRHVGLVCGSRKTPLNFLFSILAGLVQLNGMLAGPLSRSRSWQGYASKAGMS